jgi:UDPglucose 6-dehydrogenase
VLGLTFKPETDDMRDAPSLVVVPKLVEAGAAIRAFDPQGGHARQMLPGSVVFCGSAMEAAQGADAVVLLTEWNEFRALPPEKLRAAMRGDVVLDLRNVWEPDAMRAAGFRYESIGRP